MGFVSQKHADKAQAVDAGLAMAARLAAKSPVAVQRTKEMLNYGREHSTADSLRYTAVWNSVALQGGRRAGGHGGRWAEGRSHLRICRGLLGARLVDGRQVFLEALGRISAGAGWRRGGRGGDTSSSFCLSSATMFSLTTTRSSSRSSMM